MEMSHSTTGASWLLQITVVCGHERIPILYFCLLMKAQPNTHHSAQALGVSIKPF